jgi:3',5'-cyclic-AMP phosphodiesterase
MAIKEDSKEQHRLRLDRREALTCMKWAGTGLLWTLSGGIPLTSGLIDSVLAAPAGQGSFSFLQISDSHIGFNMPANSDALGTLREAIAKIKALPIKPAFMIHAGDISHLSKDEDFRLGAKP